MPIAKLVAGMDYEVPLDADERDCRDLAIQIAQILPRKPADALAVLQAAYLLLLCLA